MYTPRVIQVPHTSMFFVGVLSTRVVTTFQKVHSCRHLLAFLLLQHFFDMNQTSIPFARWGNPKFRHRLRVLLHDDFPPLRKNKGYFSRSVFDDVQLSCCSTLGFLFGVAFGVVFSRHGCTEQVVAANVTVVGT